MNQLVASPFLVIGLILFAVVLFNAVLIMQVRQRTKMNDDVTMMKNAIDSAMNPWKKSDQEFDELAELVKKVQKQTLPEEEEPE